MFLEKLQDRFDETVVIKTLELLSGKDYDAAIAVNGDSVAPWAVEEVAWFCEQIVQAGDDFDDKKFVKKIKQDIAGLRKNLLSCLDIALSGRMATSGLLTEVGKVDGFFNRKRTILEAQGTKNMNGRFDRRL